MFCMVLTNLVFYSFCKLCLLCTCNIILLACLVRKVWKVTCLSKKIKRSCNYFLHGRKHFWHTGWRLSMWHIKLASPFCHIACLWTVSKRKWNMPSCIKKNNFFDATDHSLFFWCNRSHTSPLCYIAHRWPQHCSLHCFINQWYL